MAVITGSICTIPPIVLAVIMPNIHKPNKINEIACIIVTTSSLPYFSHFSFGITNSNIQSYIVNTILIHKSWRFYEK